MIPIFQTAINTHFPGLNSSPSPQPSRTIIMAMEPCPHTTDERPAGSRHQSCDRIESISVTFRNNSGECEIIRVEAWKYDTCQNEEVQEDNTYGYEYRCGDCGAMMSISEEEIIDYIVGNDLLLGVE